MDTQQTVLQIVGAIRKIMRTMLQRFIWKKEIILVLKDVICICAAMVYFLDISQEMFLLVEIIFMIMV